VHLSLGTTVVHCREKKGSDNVLQTMTTARTLSTDEEGITALNQPECNDATASPCLEADE